MRVGMMNGIRWHVSIMMMGLAAALCHGKEPEAVERSFRDMDHDGVPEFVLSNRYVCAEIFSGRPPEKGDGKPEEGDRQGTEKS